MRYLNPLRYIHYHTQLAIPTIYDDSLSFYISIHALLTEGDIIP